MFFHGHKTSQVMVIPFCLQTNYLIKKDQGGGGESLPFNVFTITKPTNILNDEIILWFHSSKFFI